MIERDAENSYLNLDGFDDDEVGAMPDLYGHSITYRIALGFFLHAGVSARADQRDKLERPGGDPLCRCISRPAVSERRLSFTGNGQIRYQLKTPYRDGTTHVIFDRGGHQPLDLLARLAALALSGPTPASGEPDGGAQPRFHGVFAWGGHPSNSACRARSRSNARGRAICIS